MLCIQISDNLDLTNMKILRELVFYVQGDRPTYKRKWAEVDFILAPYNVDEHWAIARIDLVK